jgi:signal transduction histidine kinase
MNMQFPDSGILYVDDEEKSLKYFAAIFDQIAPIYVADSPEEGYRIFVENHDRIGLVLSDKKMPGESGIDLLQRIRDFDPRPFRFLVTAYADLNVAVDALNDGLLYSYLSKPWDPEDLEHRLIRALRHFCLSQERERILREKTEAIEQLVRADRAAGIGILSAGLNHHIRNSLTVLRTFYDMLPMQFREELGREPEDNSFWGDFYNEVGGQMNRMTDMLSRLADGVSSGSSDEHEKIDVTEAIRAAMELVLPESGGIEMTIDVEEEIPVINGDLQKIGQMFRLLFQEAKASIGGSGEVEVRVRKGGETEGVTITVLDSAPLIPEKDLVHLFDAFFVRSDRPESLGTNLLACYLTAFHHGGAIRAFHSDEGRNAIEVNLPVEPPVETGEERIGSLLSSYRGEGADAKACDMVLPG